MQRIDPLESYKQHLESLNIQLQKLVKQKKWLEWFRFFSFAAAVIVLWQLWPLGWLFACTGFILFAALFIFFVVRDIDNKEKIENTKRLAEINQEEIEILSHNFINRHSGQSLQPAHHDYSNDLDLFGKASLYQYINRTHSEQGAKLLAEWMLYAAEPAMIINRQEAAKELAEDIFSLQQFRAHSTANPLTIDAEQKVMRWLQQENKFLMRPAWKMIRFIFPAMATAILLFYLFSVISSSLFYPLLLLFFVIAFSISKYIMPHYVLLNKIVPELETLYQSVRWIENLDAKTKLVKTLKENMNAGSEKTSTSIRQLKKILERLDYRYNPLVYVPLNLFLLWDLQQVIALEKWKTEKKKNAGQWFNSLTEMETLMTLATIHFNHPYWCFPQLNSGHGIFIAKDLGHPLIPAEKRVTNSFTARGQEQLSLITGSNMAGKSTFLRSAGLNIVLAMMGSPVCARELIVSPMKVISSMRVSDNLEENTSTFYAELKKLKEIIEAVNKHEKVFLLLDEILRGTNSADRHNGSKAFIKQLIKEEAAALVATHDLELTQLAEEFPGRIRNYHFDVQIKGDELFFDYILKEGICRSMNASLLMKKIGIDI
ncbi:MAG TPA: hypothetical protein VGQ09_02000 [Chitinophagaceae bacterium]|jgi:ABC-type multidrug transport system fused ATPase/permease subunit|nr:hypothetical protein [Chitinophagaceae bacterium]